MLKIIKTETYDQLSQKAAKLVAKQINTNPFSIMAFASGGTPIGMFNKLTEMAGNGRVSFADVVAFNLNEYVGIDGNHPQSYHYVMQRYLYDGIDIPEENIVAPDGMTKDIFGECSGYDQLIANYGGIDMIVLGIGKNGHIGFNEPGDVFISGSHLAELKESTIQANSRFFDSIDDVPHYALTVGIRSIMMAQKIVLLASGKGKATAVKKALYDDVTPQVPASILQYHHDVTVILDEGAASKLDEEE